MKKLLIPIVLVVLIARCVEEGTEAIPTKPSEAAEAPITEEEAQTELFATVTHGSVMTMVKN